MGVWAGGGGAACSCCPLPPARRSASVVLYPLSVVARPSSFLASTHLATTLPLSYYAPSFSFPPAPIPSLFAASLRHLPFTKRNTSLSFFTSYTLSLSQVPHLSSHLILHTIAAGEAAGAGAGVGVGVAGRRRAPHPPPLE
ncbi:hypothetical protein E2C01_073264 [Portunus trituberculatus]|uniref:Uncharacterized protein n=1 Tax=Portunus trituberculatus TaxID=210409 RepID=A0A5B7IB85_PORTR|nr:hypothetical protein [Portunus trituberculatus]